MSKDGLFSSTQSYIAGALMVTSQACPPLETSRSRAPSSPVGVSRAGWSEVLELPRHLGLGRAAPLASQPSIPTHRASPLSGHWN